MMRASRLIEDFRMQTKETVLEHMDKLALNQNVYSSLVKGFDPYLKEYNTIIYIHATDLVVVCFDLCGKKEELADEGDTLDVDAPEYFSSRGPRTSPVWQLSEAMKEMSNRTVNIFPPMNIYGVLLSESTFMNANDMKYKWETMNIHVIDGLKGLRYREMATNRLYSEKAGLVMKAILGEDYRHHDSGIIEDKLENYDGDRNSDDFEKLLNQFIAGDFEFADEDESDDTDLDIYEDGDGFDNDKNDEIDLNDFPKGSVHKIEDISFPDGEIEQNQNISVKVEILRPIANPQEELDKLVGCTNIKKRMDELMALTRYNKMMRGMFPDCKQHDVSLHSVFLGRPGTGKTTVCKIFGSLLRQAGALSKGHVVVCDRGTFIGTLWGDEERSMRQVLEMARGGVLMIDEAYLLNGKHENDPGKIVVQLMMSILADETQRDIAIVLCGYKEPMEKLLDANPGLQSRLPNKFEFADFAIDELLEITRRRVKEYEYAFTPAAWEKYKQILTQAYQQRNPQTWGNARFVANQLERIYIQHAMRCVRQKPTDKRQLLLLTPEDIQSIDVPKEKKHIGFC